MAKRAEMKANRETKKKTRKHEWLSILQMLGFSADEHRPLPAYHPGGRRRR